MTAASPGAAAGRAPGGDGSCRTPFGNGQHDRTVTHPTAPPARAATTDEVVTVYPARAVLTMDRQAPRAAAVAVAGERIFAVGSLDGIVDGLTLAGRDHVVDHRFADHVLMPGFIEPHCHAMNVGLFWQYHYVGAVPMRRPDGSLAEGMATREAVLASLAAAAKADPSSEPLIAWGYDPALLEGSLPLDRSDLDAVSGIRPVVVLNMSGHIAYVNSVVLDGVGYDEATTVPGVRRGPDGALTGEVQELAALMPITSTYVVPDDALMTKAMWDVARVAQRVGCTTITDLAAGTLAGGVGVMQAVGADHHYPVRVSAYVLHEVVESMGVDALRALQDHDTEYFRVAGVKFVLDGSIQGYTANLKWPYYYDGHPNGRSTITTDDLEAQLRGLAQAGIQCALHANGDAASQQVIDAVDGVVAALPGRDHRFRMEHCQMVTDDQLAEMARLRIAANIFVNHLYYWGDFHARRTLGPDRVRHMNPLAGAQRHGVRFSLHSDSWVTPIDPLHMVWTAAARKTSSGAVLGPDECITVTDALRAVTADAAFLLREETEKGSIEVGKLADLVVLSEEPSDDDVDALLGIEVVATVLAGRVVEVGSF
ncbi:MAG TPA: amidohydrolase [Acidimicrobiales bacterium]|nr:amidohydrolase [Acidimicrobiales bacterium]